MRGLEPAGGHSHVDQTDPQAQAFGFLTVLIKWKLLVGKRNEWVGSVHNPDLWACMLEASTGPVVPD